jgi:hypothetical protein
MYAPVVGAGPVCLGHVGCPGKQVAVGMRPRALGMGDSEGRPQVLPVYFGVLLGLWAAQGKAAVRMKPSACGITSGGREGRPHVPPVYFVASERRTHGLSREELVVLLLPQGHVRTSAVIMMGVKEVGVDPRRVHLWHQWRRRVC